MQLSRSGGYWATPAVTEIINGLQMSPFFVSIADLKAAVDKERARLGLGYPMLKRWDYLEDESGGSITFRKWERVPGKKMYPGVRPMSDHTVTRSFSLPLDGDDLEVEMTSPFVLDTGDTGVRVRFQSGSAVFTSIRSLVGEDSQYTFLLTELAPEADIGWVHTPFGFTIIFLRGEELQVQDYFLEEVKILFQDQVRYVKP